MNRRRGVCPTCGQVIEPAARCGWEMWPLTVRGRVLCPQDRTELIFLPLDPEARQRLQRILAADLDASQGGG